MISDRRAEDLINAALSNDGNAIRKLIERGIDPNQRNILGYTALHVAAFRGNLEAVKALIESGADIDCGDEFSTVNEVANLRNLHFLEVLMIRENHFDFRLRANSNFSGCSALHYAILADHQEVFQYLLEQGADPTKKNDVGHFPIDYSKDEKTEQILQNFTQKFQEIKKKREEEERRRFPLEQRIKQNIVGQESAINIVCSSKIIHFKILIE